MRNLAAAFGRSTVRDAFASKLARWHRSLRFVALLFLFGLLVSDVAAAAGRNVQLAPAVSLGSGPSFAIADFDGDQRPDVATVETGRIGFSSTDYRIQFHLTVSGWQAIQVVAPSGGLQLEARDVNGDHAVDLVLTSALFKQPVAVFLNDGHGGFSRAEPSKFPEAFTDSQRDWSSPSNQVLGAVGVPPQSRSEICSEAKNLLDARGPADSLPASRLVSLPDSFRIACAGRAPPFEVSQL